MKSKISFLAIAVAISLVMAACGSTVPAPEAVQQPAEEQSTANQPKAVPSVSVQDQNITDGKVVVQEVFSVGAGWLVIHAQADGKPGPILGYAQVADGQNTDILVEIDLSNASSVLYAMLHTDAGMEGYFEFPEGDDTPVAVDGQVVTPSFTVSLPDLVPAVTVSDQTASDGIVEISEVISKGPGWLVVHAQADGKPGPILGFTSVADGVNSDVLVEINTANATSTLYAMLHMDAGEIGTFEFPDGEDGPVIVDEAVVTPAFNLLFEEAPVTEISSREAEPFGIYLTDSEGMSLYIFLNDSPAVSNCYDACAVNWPPFLTAGNIQVGEGLNENLLGITERTDGTMQVTYNGWPLYYWINDVNPGDVTGQGVNSIWYVIDPDGNLVQ